MVVVKRTDLKTTDRKRKELARNDNATTDSSKFDNEELLVDFTPKELKEWEIEIPNVENDLNDLKDLSEQYEKSFEVVVECINEEEQQMTYDKLIAEGYKCRILTL